MHTERYLTERPQAEHCDVVHVVNQMRPGGIETMVLDIVRHSRHASRVFSLGGTSEQLVNDWSGLAAIASSLEGFARPDSADPMLVWRLARRFRALKPRAIFMHRLNPLLYGGLAARLTGVPTIVHVEHDVWQYDDPRRLRLLKRTVSMVRPIHFAVSPAIAAALEEMLPAPRVNVVPGGVDLVRFRRRDRTQARLALGLPGQAHVIGTAGRLEPVKGHRVLVAAMAHLPEDVHVLILGDGSQRDALLAQAREIGVKDRLHLLGHRDDLELIMPAMDVFCLPSLGEGLPRVLMEAQGADLPIVASDVGSVNQVVDPATGRLVAANDPDALAQALIASLATPPAAGTCRAYAEARFGIDRLVAQYDDMVGPSAKAA